MGMDKDIFLVVLDKIVEKEGLITQTEIAHDTGLSQSSISNYLTGKSKPRAKSISKIIEVFKTRLNMSDEGIKAIGEANIKVDVESHALPQQEGGDNLVSLHQKIVKEFRFKQKGIDANQALLKIENLDYEAFFQEVARLEALAIRLEEKKLKEAKAKKQQQTQEGAAGTGTSGGENPTGTDYG